MLTRSALLHLSRSQAVKSLLTRFNSFNAITRRFVAGETLEDAADAIRSLNRNGISASFDHLGESIESEEGAGEEVAEYIRVLEAIEDLALNSNVSVKLTQLGLDIDEEICYRNTRRIVEAAASRDNFVRIDMEDSLRTDATLRTFTRLRREFSAVGIVIQSYLRRSESDVENLLEFGAGMRLCKGAYSEPPSVAFARKQDVDASFVSIMRKLLASGTYHGIATHDDRMIEATRRFADEQRVDRGGFEFQMLYGVRRELQESLVKEGYRVRVYVPYGMFWYPYFMRRLAERPANVWFVLKNLFRD